MIADDHATPDHHDQRDWVAALRRTLSDDGKLVLAHLLEDPATAFRPSGSVVRTRVRRALGWDDDRAESAIEEVLATGRRLAGGHQRV